MKKIFTSIVAVATVVVLACSSAFAAGSATGVTEVRGPEGSTISNTTIPLIAPEIAAEFVGETDTSNWEVVWQKDLSAPTLPATFTFNVNMEEGSMCFVYHYETSTSSWELVRFTSSSTFDVTFRSLSPVAIVVKTPKPATPAAPAAPVAPATPVAPAAETVPATEDVVAPVVEEAPIAEATPVAAPETGNYTVAVAMVTIVLACSAAYVVSIKKEEA